MLNKHEKDYKEDAWRDYSVADLGMWVALLMKRSQHRDNETKRKKDLYDAQNYLDMIQSQLNFEVNLIK